MTEDSKIKEFPDISNKLTAPSKKSIFERQKAEAEAKRQREQEETAAVYEDFVKSFDDDGGNNSTPSGPSSKAAGAGSVGASSGFSKRHFSGPAGGPSGRGGKGISGPGSLGPPPSSLSRKRAYDGPGPPQREGIFAFEDESFGPAGIKTTAQQLDDGEGEVQRSEDRAVPKPTLRMSSLPLGISPAAIKAVLPSTLTVEGIRILPPSAPSPTDRKSVSAVVTLAKDTPALDIDTAVSALQNRYMGRGFFLTLSRHLSSAINLDSSAAGLSSASSTLPFNAKPLAPPNMPRGAQSGPHRGGYAPPSSYIAMPPQFGRGSPQLQVTVTPPADLKELKLIHKTIESLLTHGPEFEALLMSRKEVQHDPRWAWIWDSRSNGGVYYRWRLWDILTGFSRRSRRGRNLGLAPQQVFENGASWAMPDRKLPFEYTTSLAEIVSDSDYNSSEDEDSGNEGRRRYAQHHGGAPPPDVNLNDADTQVYLNPMQKAKLTHLLARLPSSSARLRRGDVARVTAFAIQHAGEGADEVVQMIIANIHQPFSFTSANAHDHDIDGKDEDAVKDTDNTPAKLIALYIVSDILSTSSTSGVRHAWRYRSLFESALKSYKTFEHLGRLEKTLNWGRLRAEKWKRSVGSVLSLWEGWCVFPQAAQEHFSKMFNDPPLAPAEEAAKAEEEAKAEKEKTKSKWKSVEDRKAEAEAEAAAAAAIPTKSGKGTVNDGVDADVDGEPIDADEDLDGEPMMEDDDLDGEPMPDSDEELVPEQQPNPPPQPEPNRREALAASIAAKLGKPPPAATAIPVTEEGGVVRKRQRPKAEDMFADSDGE